MRLLASLASLAIFTGILLAQPPDQTKKGPPAAKNLQVLTEDELHSGLMQKYAAALGGNCLTCHVAGTGSRPDFASDENPHKVIARNIDRKSVV